MKAIALVECVLCQAMEREAPRWQNDDLMILDCLNKKGHGERVMIISKEHRPKTYDDLYDKYMVNILSGIARDIFSYTYRFVIMAPDYATVPDHPHFIATDLEGDSEDHRQILGTRWLKNIQVNKWERIDI